MPIKHSIQTVDTCPSYIADLNLNKLIARSLSITWGIPDLRDDYKSSPGSYLGHLIGKKETQIIGTIKTYFIQDL